MEIHVLRCTNGIFASNLLHWDKTSRNTSEFLNQKHGGDSMRRLFLPFTFPAPCRPPAIKTPPRPVPGGPLISWSENASCSRIPSRASLASFAPRWWATTCCRLPLRPWTAPLSCSLQILKLSELLLWILCVMPLICSSYSNFAPPSPSISSWWQRNWETFTHTLVLQDSLKPWWRRVSPRRSTYILIVGLDYCVMCFAYALHVHHPGQNLVSVFRLYAKPNELVIEIVFHYYNTPSCHKISLFIRPF